jgi:hypothetical protein
VPSFKQEKRGRRTAARILITLLLGLAFSGSYIAGVLRGTQGGKGPLALAHLFLDYVCPNGDCGYNDTTARTQPRRAPSYGAKHSSGRPLRGARWYFR